VTLDGGTVAMDFILSLDAILEADREVARICHLMTWYSGLTAGD
jgi:hypothetical protein